jgi:hypothetical protein
MECRLFCFAPYAGGFAVHHQLDLAISTGVFMKGGSTTSLGCENFYDRCEVLLHTSYQNYVAACINCANKGRTLLEHKPLPFLTLNELVTPEEVAHVQRWSAEQDPLRLDLVKYQGHAVGQWTLSSVLTAFQVTAAQVSRPDVMAFYRTQIKNSALTSIAVERVIANYNPTVALVFNGRFAQYRTAFEILRKAGVRVITHERGLSDSTFFFYDNKTVDEPREFITLSSPWQVVPLVQEELERVYSYICNREHGRDFNIPASNTFTSDERLIRASLGIAEESLFAFFSSTETEMSQVEGAGIAGVQLPLLKKVLDAFRLKSNAVLVIRHHPNLSGDKQHPPEYLFLTEVYKLLIDAPPNVRCVMPTEELSSYALMWNLDGAVIPFSSVSIEIASRGVLGLCSARAAYGLAQERTFEDLGSLNVSDTIDELLEATRAFSVESLRRAYRFIYTYIARASIRFRSISMRDHYGENIDAEFVEDLKSGRDPNLTRIVDGILTGQNIYPRPSAEDLARTDSVETAFLESRLADVKAKRASVREAARSCKLAQHTIVRLAEVPRSSIYPLIFDRRGEPTEHVEIAVDDGPRMLASIKQAVTRSDAEFVVYAYRKGSFDGHFLVSGSEALASADKRVQMVLRGVWIARQDGVLYDHFISKISGAPSLEGIESIFKRPADPLQLLSLGFYRRDYFCRVVDELQRLWGTEQAIHYIANEWASERCLVKLGQAGLTVVS